MLNLRFRLLALVVFQALFIAYLLFSSSIVSGLILSVLLAMI